MPTASSTDSSCGHVSGGQYAAAHTGLSFFFDQSFFLHLIFIFSFIIAGVVALMLEATNHRLSPFDIAHILVESATFPPQVRGERNGAGLSYNDQIGFGMIDAGKAVKNALQYPGHFYPLVLCLNSLIHSFFNSDLIICVIVLFPSLCFIALRRLEIFQTKGRCRLKLLFSRIISLIGFDLILQNNQI